MNTARRKPKGPFAVIARRYRAAGFLGTVPLPVGMKGPPPNGYTGHGAPYPTDADVRRWRRERGDGNIGLRLAEVPGEFLSDRDDLPVVYAGNNVDGWDLIGVDVDDYGGKTGATQLRELEGQLGELPATGVSSARWEAAPASGTRVFLVPRGYKYKGKAAKHIDIVYRGLRYLAVHPSVHPDGDAYEWRYGVPRDGATLRAYDDSAIPSLNDVAVLPERWFRHLVSGTGDYAEAKTNLDFDALDDWAEATFHDCNGAPCGLMAGDLAGYADRLDDSDQHTPLNTAIWRLTMNALEGHAGWATAVTAYLRHWAEISSAKRSREELTGEWQRSVRDALSKAKAIHDKQGGYVPDDRCAVDTGKCDPEDWAERHADALAAVGDPPRGRRHRYQRRYRPRYQATYRPQRGC